ncbi:MAG: TVP38/TMEM64 family protein [Anaerolineales bacterium]|nr:MAG: TVP38/TMEM64 family protein [Anaerolineales bacterium]
MLIKRIVLVIGLLLVLIALWIYREPIGAWLGWFSNLNAVIETIRGYGWWGPAILFVLFILQAFLAFIPGQALMIGSGILYGFFGGFLLTWVSLVLGGQIAFWLSRTFGRPFAEKWVTAETLDRWDKSAAGQGMAFYVITLVMPFVPNDAMCYVAGLGNMSPKRFLLANMLGRGIASLLTATVGANLIEIPAILWVFLVGFVVLGIAGWVFAKRMQKAESMD